MEEEERGHMRIFRVDRGVPCLVPGDKGIYNFQNLSKQTLKIVFLVYVNYTLISKSEKNANYSEN